MVVRKMTEGDTKAVYDLSVECFSEPWSLESIQKEVDNPVASYFVAEEEGHVIGYGGLWHVLDEGDIINIAVSSLDRRKGVGQVILETLIKEAQCQGVSIIHLEVRQSNDAAKRLYEKHGFSQIAIRKNYYHHPMEDALIMSYQLG